MRGTKQPRNARKFFAPTLSEFCPPLFRPWAKSCIRPCPHINTVLYDVHAFWWGDCELNSSTFHYFVDKLLKYSSFLWGDCELSSSHSHYFSLCVRTGADTGISSGGGTKRFSGALRPFCPQGRDREGGQKLLRKGKNSGALRPSPPPWAKSCIRPCPHP